MEEQQNDVQNIISNQEDELDSLNSNKNQKKSGKKKTIAIVGILLLVGAIGISFAYWMSTATQESINKITSGCLQVTIKDINNSAIDLAEAYPISDSEAAELTPYTFEIENICNASAEYNINLEVLKSLKEDTDQLNSNYVAVSFDGGSKRVLTNYTSVEPTYSDDEYRAIESYNLYSNGTLARHEKKQYTIKLWIDETAEGKDIMNQTFLSKISVTSGVAVENKKTLAVDYIKNLAESSSDLMEDGTSENNVRYIGSDPNNYVTFNGELWRIIGVMNNVSDSEGQSTSRLKLIRNESIGDFRFSDNAGSTSAVWKDDNMLRRILNEVYYNKSTSGFQCSSCSDLSSVSSLGLTENSRNMITSIKWDILDYNNHSGYFYSTTASEMYLAEKNKMTYENSGSAPFTPIFSETWEGMVGLMSPSDYAYASGIKECEIASSSTSPATHSCSTNNWLHSYNWLLNMNSTTNNDDYYNNTFVYSIKSGGISPQSISQSTNVRPTVYLNADIEFDEENMGDGSSSNPYILKSLS